MQQFKRLQEIRFVSRPDQLRGVRKAIRDALAAKALSPDVIDSVVLAADEACSNIIKHAYGAHETGEIVLEIFYSGEQVRLRVTDFADPVDRRSICSRDLCDIRPGGLGVHLIHQVMDAVEFLDPPAGVGNVLEMRKNIRSS